jgi:outer membrane protein
MNKKLFRAFLFMSLLSSYAAGIAQLPISMQDAFQLASKGNRQLMVQTIEANKAAEAIKESKSYLLPSVLANGSYNVYGERPVIYLRNESAEGNKVNDVKFGGRYAFDGNIAATYSVVNGQLRSDVRKAIIDSKIQEQQVNLTDEDIAWQIGQIYLDILLMQENRISLVHSLQRNEHSLKDSRSLFLQGKNLKTDTLSNYISVQNLKSVLIKIENEISVKKKYLQHLLGLADSVEIVLTDSLDANIGSTFNLMEVESKAQENRKDLKMQKLLIEKNAEELNGLKAAFKPQLSAFAQYQFQNQSDNLKFGQYSFPRTSFIGLKASVPIYSGRRLRYKTNQLQLTQQQIEVQLADTRSRISIELEEVQTGLSSAYNDYGIQQQNVEAALINYTMMRDRYRNGLGSRLEVTDAEVALTKARLDLVRSIHLIRVKQLQLQKTIGTLNLKTS